MIINSPLFVTIPRKTKADKKWIMNLNNYRNTHYQTLNQAKIIYKEVIKSHILPLPRLNEIEIQFTLYPRTKRLTDIGNVCSIQEKFFLDALVEFKKIEDDNYNFVQKITYNFGAVDKNNPRVEIKITPINRIKQAT